MLENEIKKGEKAVAELKISLNDEFIDLKNKINLVESTQTEEQKSLLIKIKDGELITNKKITESLSVIDSKVKSLEQEDITIKYDLKNNSNKIEIISENQPKN